MTVHQTRPTVCLCLLDETLSVKKRAQHLVHRLGFPLIDLSVSDGASEKQEKLLQAHTEQYDLALLMTSRGLSLKDTATRMRPFAIDLSSQTDYQRRLAGHRSQSLLGKALGVTKSATREGSRFDGAQPGNTRLKSARPKVIDCTAGMARDAWQIAAMGCEVTMLERSPLLSLLIEDALLRAEEDGSTRQGPAGRLRIIEADAKEFLQSTGSQNVSHENLTVYIDTMFPEKKGKALPGGEMQLLQKLLSREELSSEEVSTEDGAEEILRIAGRSGYKKVVVKRPLSWKWPKDLSVNYSVKGKSIRFDVFLFS